MLATLCKPFIYRKILNIRFLMTVFHFILKKLLKFKFLTGRWLSLSTKRLYGFLKKYFFLNYNFPCRLLFLNKKIKFFFFYFIKFFIFLNFVDYIPFNTCNILINFFNIIILKRFILLNFFITFKY